MLSFWDYWGKSAPGESDVGSRACHLLPYHLLDVAAVGRELLRRDAALSSRLCRLLELEPDQLSSLIVFFLAIHDLGKFCDSFQAKSPESFRKLRGRPPSPRPGSRHWDLGYLLWQETAFRRVFDLLASQERFAGLDELDLEDYLLPLARAVMGHHGQPPLESASSGISLKDHATTDDLAAAGEWLRTVCALAPPSAWAPPVLEEKSFDRAHKASWLLAGLTVISDWLGSNQDFFPPLDQPMDPARYFQERALPQAGQAILASQAVAPPAAAFSGLTGLFPELPSPTPLQEAAQELAPGREPRLVIIEDVTGSGKTEAALVIAHALLASQAASGVFFGLPTMATSNAMYDRLGKSYRRLFGGGAEPSLVLAHGSRSQHQGFLASLSRSAPLPDEPEAPYCGYWLADNRKKALLAPVGVGTIDQALLGVLPSRHQSLRLLGLSRNVLIVDEVHAYDSYTNQLLCRLLEFQAALGGSAVLLSASLPQATRKELARAFQAGCGGPCREPAGEGFPQITVAAGGAISERQVPAWSRSRREVAVEFIHDPGQAERILLAAAGEGRCACWIRNTVADAREAAQGLAGRLPSGDLLLFHARFAMCDRLAREREVLELFGKESSPAQRAGKVLVATQVVEQSLDLDFDVLISDLAPVDLMIQRAGRLHRHQRGERGKPTLAILAPEFSQDPAASWYEQLFPRAAYVYPDHGQLWLTAQCLRRTGAIKTPEGVRELMEEVYGGDWQERIPPGLSEQTLQTQGRRLSENSLAHYNQLGLAEGYAHRDDKWLPDVSAPTRLGDPSATLRLARWDGRELKPWCRETGLGEAWALSQVDVPARLAAGPAPWAGDLARACREALERMPDQGRWCVLAPLQANEQGQWQGQVFDGQGRTILIQYKEQTGLTIHS